MTNLQVNLPASQQATLAHVAIAVRLVRTLVNAVVPAAPGELRWDSLDQSGRGEGSGTYFARQTTAGRTSVKTLTLVPTSTALAGAGGTIFPPATCRSH